MKSTYFISLRNFGLKLQLTQIKNDSLIRSPKVFTLQNLPVNVAQNLHILFCSSSEKTGNTHHCMNVNVIFKL